MNEITQSSGVGPVTVIGRYLDILQQMRLVTRHVPVTESQPEKSKKGLYKIDDHFLRFWFRYVHPNLPAVDLGLADAILDQRVRPNLDSFISAPFEEACRAYIVQQARLGKLPFLPERVGGWWDREEEIDVAAVSESERALLVGECKWSKNLVGTNVLDGLKRKVASVAPDREWRSVHTYLFARTGFTEELIGRARSENVHLITVSDFSFTE